MLVMPLVVMGKDTNMPISFNFSRAMVDGLKGSSQIYDHLVTFVAPDSVLTYSPVQKVHCFILPQKLGHVGAALSIAISCWLLMLCLTIVKRTSFAWINCGSNLFKLHYLSSVLPINCARYVYFPLSYPKSNLMATTPCLDLFNCCLQGQNVVLLVLWQEWSIVVKAYENWKYWLPFYNLEDKLGLHGVESDTIYVFWVQSLLEWMFYYEETIEEIKVVEVRMMERTRRMKMLPSSWVQFIYVLQDKNVLGLIHLNFPMFRL
jgi:hypothetical protein